MNTINNFFDKYRGILALVVVLVLLLNTCSLKSQMASLKKDSLNREEVESLLRESTVSPVQLKVLLKSTTKDILRYDEDVDKHTKSIEDVMDILDKDITSIPNG